MAEEDTIERKDGTERRVYNLPGNLLARLRAFQSGQGIASEAEAVRRLLDSALQMRDSVEDILKSMQKRFEEEKDLRVLASEILTRHALVTQIVFEENAVWFRVKSGERGQFDCFGARYTGRAEEADDNWNYVRDPAPSARGAGPSWEAPASDLDDEIPF